ncbi:MAG TPA: neocarzinostatin apoprotein domain-containing protein [Acidimicrobiales bacterium]|nr:neocarzinostatin apoprotein domain-containing protein [Acidimicrobiales bacterium]
MGPSRTTPVACVVLALLVAAVSACGGGDSTVVRPPESSAPVLTATTTTSSPPTTMAPLGSQRVTVSPDTGLSSGQHVRVTGAGFSPSEALVVTECAAKDTATGPGDCNLDGLVMTTSDASGQVDADLVVMKGPFGANGIVCGSAQPCLVSVTQATPSPTQEADTHIAFS